MPAVGSQGSRGGLLTAVVVFTILFVTATVVAIYFGVDDGKKTDELQTQAERTKTIYGPQDLSNLRYQEIASHLTPGQTILSVALQDAQLLAESINGRSAVNAKTPGAAADQRTLGTGRCGAEAAEP